MFAARLLLVTVAAFVVSLTPSATSAAGANDCEFVLGFAAFHDLLPRQVGQCLDDEQHNPADGDGVQHTTGGLLVWRKADNWTAFTDGYATWVDGPKGLEYRLNTQRFAWEANPDGLPVVPDAFVGTAQSSQPGPRLLVDERGGPGPLRFQVTGSGFMPGEAVTVRGSYTRAFLVATGNPQSPATRQTCAGGALGPVEAQANGSGDFTAAIEVRAHVETVDFAITASGSSGASVSVVAGALEPARVTSLPADCGALAG